MKNRMKQCASLFVLLAVLFASCREGDDGQAIPEPDPIENEIEVIINDFDGNGILPGLWTSTADGDEMTDYTITVDPDGDQSDSVFYMAGSDSNEDWWIATSLGGDATNGTPLGLPADASKIIIQFDLYAANSTANLEIQLQQTDGDVFSWNLGADGGYQATEGVWTTYKTSVLSDYPLAGFTNGGQGDEVFAPELLSNVSVALISGNATGNSSALYLDNIKFLITDVSDVAYPSNLSAEAISQSQIDLNWTDNSSNETGFVIQKANTSGEFVAIDTVEAGITTYSDMGLSSATTYSYQVYAIADGKTSTTSNIVDVATEAAATTTTVATTFDSDEEGILSGEWASTSDDDELVEYDVVVNPDGISSTDSVLYMRGTDRGETLGSEWWIGSALGGDMNGTSFGFPADVAKISVTFDLYAGNGTTNLDLQLQEADGDVFVWNFGGDGHYSASEGEWTTYTVSFSDFYLGGSEDGGWAREGDLVFAPELLSNFSIALISGGEPGNEAIAYINNLNFIISE